MRGVICVLVFARVHHVVGRDLLLGVAGGRLEQAAIQRIARVGGDFGLGIHQRAGSRGLIRGLGILLLRLLLLLLLLVEHAAQALVQPILRGRRNRTVVVLLR